MVVAVNKEKNPLFSEQERKELIRESISDINNVNVTSFNGLVVEYAKEKNALAIVRGLRHVSDFEFEFEMAMMNFHLNEKISSLFMMPDEKYIHLNSSVVKDVSKNGGDISAFVPKCVSEALFAKFSK